MENNLSGGIAHDDLSSNIFWEDDNGLEHSDSFL